MFFIDKGLEQNIPLIMFPATNFLSGERETGGKSINQERETQSN